MGTPRTGREVPCPDCGTLIYRRPSAIERGRTYCWPCYVEAKRSGRLPVWNKGKATSPFYWTKNGREVECPRCGKATYKTDREIREGRRYCSRECFHRSRWGPSRRRTSTCPICKQEFSHYAGARRVTCSIKCRYVLTGIQNRGSGSPMWRGGKTAPYNGEWKSQRRKAIERDDATCVHCGATGDVMVHHIEPYRYSESHDLDNLETVCRSCHGKEEWKVNQRLHSMHAPPS